MACSLVVPLPRLSRSQGFTRSASSAFGVCLDPKFMCQQSCAGTIWSWCLERCGLLLIFEMVLRQRRSTSLTHYVKAGLPSVRLVITYSATLPTSLFRSLRELISTPHNGALPVLARVPP